MNLTSLQTSTAANSGRVMPVLHPNDRTPLFAIGAKPDEKIPVTITLLGKDSDAFIKAENAARNRAVEQIKKQVKFSAAAADLEASQTLARCTTAWTGIPQGWLDGSDDESPADFSPEAALALYTNLGVRWVRDQVDEFVAERANFLTRSPTS